MKKLLLILFALLTLCACGEKQYTGSFEYDTKPKDELLNIEVDTPILIRNVEMVQYYKDDTGVKTVLANYLIESFEDDGKTYTNPEFPSDFTNQLFFSNLTIQENVLSEELIYAIVNSESVEKIQVTDLDKEAGLQYNLVVVDNSYVTASDDWQVGDIKVTYYCLKPTVEYNITAKLKDNVLISTKKFEISNIKK